MAAHIRKMSLISSWRVNPPKLLLTASRQWPVVHVVTRTYLRSEPKIRSSSFTLKALSPFKALSSLQLHNGRIWMCNHRIASTARYSQRAGNSNGTDKKTISNLKLLLIAPNVAFFSYFLYRYLTRDDSEICLATEREISLYRRMPLKTVSRLWGKFNQVDLPVFLRKPLLGLYIWAFGCNLDEAQVQDLNDYRNLGEFFRRKLKPHVRPIDQDHVLTSPADGRILHYGLVRQGILEQVKGVTYSLRGFLGPNSWDSASHGQDINHQSDEEFQARLPLQSGNSLYHCIIYLAPGDYHRFHSPTSWKVDHRRHFPGELLSVSPGIAKWVQGLFNYNERAVYTGRWPHGFFSMTAVGATNVGSIKIYCDEELETNVRGKYPDLTYFDKKFGQTIPVEKGEMFGEFNLGSTIVLVFEAPADFSFKVAQGQKIQFGQPLGAVP